MKKIHGFLLGFGLVVAAGIPIGWSVYSVQRMQNEVAIAQAAAQTAELKAQEAAAAQEEAAEKEEAEQLEQQRQIAREVAEERAQQALQENTEIAWEQFLGTLDRLETMSEESLTPEEGLNQIIAGLDAVPTNNVDDKVVSITDSVQGVFEDLRQRLLKYDADLKALDERTPGSNLSAGIDGCGVATDLLNTDSSLLNFAGCALGMATGAGISSENLKSSAMQLDSAFEQDMDNIIDRLLSMEEEMTATVSHLSDEYDIETPEKYL